MSGVVVVCDARLGLMKPKSMMQRRTLLTSAAALGAWATMERSALSSPVEASGKAVSGTAVGRSAAGGTKVGGAVRRRVGDLEVIALLDATGAFPLPTDKAFPEASTADLVAARAIDPLAFGPDNQWLLDFRCFAIRRPGGRVTIVDSGIGPEGSPAAEWAPVPGHLPDVLRRAGIDVADVDVVVMTHLHEDHVGWAVLPDGIPMFPEARYVVQQTELDHLDRAGAIWPYVVEPLQNNDRLCPIDGRTRLSGGRQAKVTLIPTPGHTVGHQSLLVEGAHEQVIVTGDALVNAVQLANPLTPYVFESDPVAAAETRSELLRRTRRRRTFLATAHLRRPFVPLPDAGSLRAQWEAGP